MNTLVKQDDFIASKIIDYFTLCKPRVVFLMILTSAVGMCLAPAPTFPMIPFIFGNLGIALVAGAAAALNHLADQHIDKQMRRTQHRPLAQNRITSQNCVIFSAVLCLSGMIILYVFINTLTAVLTFLTLIGYAVVYTLFLKHATPQNIVIGGIAGAAPPLLGWTAVTGSISSEALLLVLIIFVWTPPHFWSLAIYRLEDYAKVNVPMLPHTHGISYTKLNILLYTILLSCVALLPYLVHMAGLIYFVGAVMVNGIFLFHSGRLYFSSQPIYAIRTFRFSIFYLGILFLFLLLDHYLFF